MVRLKKMGTFKLTTMLLLAVGLISMALGILTKIYYDDLIVDGNRSVAVNRFDTIAYERARNFPMASPGMLAYNLGVLAYKAGNLERSASSFRESIDLSGDRALRGKAYYNLGNIFTLIKQPKIAAEMYRDALRINPKDWDAKYNLERLYAFNPKLFSEEGRTVNLDQVPNEKSGRSRYGKDGYSTGNRDPGL